MKNLLFLILIIPFALTGAEKSIYKLQNWQYTYADDKTFLYDGSSITVPKDIKWTKINSLFNPPGRTKGKQLWARTLLPDIEQRDSILITYFYTEVSLFINNKKFFEKKYIDIKNSKKGDLAWILHPVNSSFSQKYLYIRIHSDYKDIGYWKNLLIATDAKIIRNIIVHDSWKLVMFIVHIFAALFATTMYLVSRREQYYIRFALFALLAAFYSINHTDAKQIFFDNGQFWAQFWVSVNLMIPFASYFFLEKLFPYKYKKVIRFFWITFLIYGIAAITGNLFQQIDLLYSRYPQYILLILGFTFIIYVSIKESIEGNNEARIFFAGTLIMGLLITTDILKVFFSFFIGFDGLTVIGMFIFILAIEIIIARRFNETYKNLTLYSKKLEEADKIKDDFLANTSHELRTPLNGIIGLAESLKDRYKTISADAQEDLDLIISSTFRLSNLVNDILDYSKLKNKALTLNKSSVDLYGLSKISINLIKPLMGTKSIELKNNISTEISYVEGDENRIQQIFLNLLGNAVKFTEKGSISLDAKKITKDGIDLIEIRVKDTGIGIPHDKKDDLFKSFEQIDTSLSRKYGGTGIGLSIVKQLVELHEGEVYVNSQENKGSSFYFTLPVSLLQNQKSLRNRDISDIFNEEEIIQVKPENNIINSLTKGTILVVDDDHVNRKVARNLLKNDGYNVILAEDGNDALEKVENINSNGTLKIDCTILDIMMPKMTGFDVAKKLRQSYSLFEMPIIIFTARDNINDMMMGFSSGANDFLTKPVQKNELLSRVKTLVTLKQKVLQHRELKYKILHDRMKPHFLFNALNTLHYLIDKDKNLAKESLHQLSDLYRFLMNDSIKDLIPFDKEWDFTLNYLAFEKIQYNDILKVEIIKDGDFSDFLIPPLTIQPLVENAIKHGIAKLSSNAIISLQSRIEENNIVITIEDNGAGFNSELSQDGTIDNIRQRLDYNFSQSSLVIESDTKRGTLINIEFTHSLKK